MERGSLMVDNIDIYRTANVLVELHGDDAPVQAAMKADALLGYSVYHNEIRVNSCPKHR
jgi:hypothetical protein